MNFNSTLFQREATCNVSVKCLLCWESHVDLLVVVRVDLFSMRQPVEVALHVIVHLRLHLVLLVHPPARCLRPLLRELSGQYTQDKVHHKKSPQDHLGEVDAYIYKDECLLHQKGGMYWWIEMDWQTNWKFRLMGRWEGGYCREMVMARGGNIAGKLGWWRWIEILEKHHWTGIGAARRDWARKER